MGLSLLMISGVPPRLMNNSPNHFYIDLFNARAHPDVKLNRKTEEEVFLTFLGSFEVHHALQVNIPLILYLIHVFNC